ncbi:MAG: Nramp family divalent metal transporter [Bacteroidota bacterium]|jgi:manganese transport protein
MTEGQDSTVTVRRGSWLRRLMSFAGPAYLVSVGYMDPGNWATDIEGGARFGYTLIWVLLMSNIMAILLQTLSARLGIVTGYDLAQGCRKEYPTPIRFVLWILAEIAIIATDLAEALGTIIGLNLLFGFPLLWGCLITAFDTLLLLAIQRLGIRKMEAFIIVMVATIGVSFFIEVFLSSPDWHGVAQGFVPRLPEGALFIAIGIIGATVMPHNLYLHSALVQTRGIANTFTAKAEACKFNFIDSSIALNAAFFVNAAILIISAADFHSRGIMVTEIQQAHKLLEPVLGSRLAPVLFALALLAAGQSSTITGTISGQVVMEGFINLRIRPWLRRLITRSIALLPAVFVIAAMGESGTYRLLILSQVVLSLQLPFAIIPLIQFTSDRKKMGLFASKAWVRLLAWIITAVIVTLNLKLVYDALQEWLVEVSPWYWMLIAPLLVLLLGILVYLLLRPLWTTEAAWDSGIVTNSRTIASRIAPHSMQRIGVALEHSDGDAEILSAAVGMAQRNEATLTLIHVTEAPSAIVQGSETEPRHSREDHAYLEELAREIEGRDLPVDICQRTGQPAKELVLAVQELRLDLLVCGSHGHRGIEDLIYGQTVDSVRHAIDIPLLIVRITDPHSERPQKSS